MSGTDADYVEAVLTLAEHLRADGVPMTAGGRVDVRAARVS
jgi:hypothetical protein